MKTLRDTCEMMCSEDYKVRFIAEYTQTKIRYEKLKKMNTQIEAAERKRHDVIYNSIKEPHHDCPSNLLLEQQHIMGDLLHVYELRAVIENIELPEM